MTKKKSNLTFILAVCSIAAAMSMMTACSKHQHSFSSEWSYSETQHWHACTNKKCEEKSDLADHDFVWVEKTPAGVHTDKVETGTCSVCQYKKDRTVEGSGADIHSWAWKYDDTKHWEETTCEHDTPLKRNEQAHTWVYTPEDELTHKRQTNCGEEKHTTITETKIAHTYTDENDVDCNDCGYVRSLTGKGSFNTLSAKTYNARPQAIASSDYTVDENIKALCEIQYKVKGANDSTYTTTAPTNAGTYEVRIYCRGNATYLKGEIAKTDYVINQLEVPVNTFFKLEKQTTSNNYITLKTYEVTDADLPSNVTLTLRAYGEKYKNQGRFTIVKTNGEFEGLQFNDTNFKPIPTFNNKPNDYVKIIIYVNETPVVTGVDQTKYNVSWIDFVSSPYVIIKKLTVTSGTLQIGDYLICEGVDVPLKVTDVELNKGGSGSEPCSGIALEGELVDIKFPIQGFTREFAETTLINTTFTKVDYEVLEMSTSSTGNMTESSSKKALNIGECRYLELTVSITKSTTFYIYPSDFAGGYYGDGAYAVTNITTGETIPTVGVNTFTISEDGTYTLVLKITKTAEGTVKDISFYVQWK